MSPTAKSVEHPPSVVRAIAILDLLGAAASAEPLPLHKIASELGLPKSSTLAICNALAEGGLLSRSAAGYSLGPKVLRLSNTYLSQLNEVDEFYRVARHLTTDAMHTVHMASLSQNLEITYLARLGGRGLPNLAPVGQSFPANCAATGKALIAELPNNELLRRLERLAPLPAMTPRSISATADVLAEVRRIRKVGYALDDEETTAGLYCVAMAVPAVPGREGRWAIGSSMVKSAVSEQTPESLLSQLREITAAFAERLGA